MTDQQRVVGGGVDPAGASTAELVKQASEQISRLVRDELALARAEMTVKAKRAGTGVGLLGAAGVVALYGVAGLLATLIIVLDLVMPLWLAALIVAVVLLAVAGVVALVGRGQVRQVGTPVPEQTVDSLKADVQTVSGAVRDRGQR
jgi:Putative Actinobacterial Holin-X, holin superfamily III